MDASRLLIPAVRWSPVEGFDAAGETIERALELGVGGFILYGGEAARVSALAADLRARAGRPLLIGSDLERGAGQQFSGATRLPPAAAIASLGDPAITREAAEVTAREAVALGINWIFAPVADLDLQPPSPIVGTRSFGSDPATVAAHVRAWVEGCRAGGARSCVKHFPGHGRASGDSHTERSEVAAGRAVLEADLAPFRAAVSAGVDSMMTAHVAYAALDAAGLPATLSRPILGDLLRTDLGFRGLLVSDALNMRSVLGEGSEAAAAVAALAAGCDALLHPSDPAVTLREIERAVSDGRLSADRIETAAARVAAAAQPLPSQPDRAGWGRTEDRDRALEIAIATVATLRGEPALPSTPFRLLPLDDDLDALHPPPSREPISAALRRAGAEPAGVGEPLILVFADVRAGKAGAGLSPAVEARAREACGSHPDATVVLFGHPRIAREIPYARNLLCAWGGESLMQEAAALWLARRGREWF